MHTLPTAVLRPEAARGFGGLTHVKTTGGPADGSPHLRAARSAQGSQGTESPVTKLASREAGVFQLIKKPWQVVLSGLS